MAAPEDTDSVPLQLVLWPKDIHFRSHMCAYIPPFITSSTANPDQGYAFHVLGNAMIGFHLEAGPFNPQHDIQHESFKYFELGRIKAQSETVTKVTEVAKRVGGWGAWKDTKGIPDGVNGKNCEIWLVEFLHALVADSQIRLDPKALDVLEANRCGPGLTVEQAQVWAKADREAAELKKSAQGDPGNGNSASVEDAGRKRDLAYVVATQQAEENFQLARKVQSDAVTGQAEIRRAEQDARTRLTGSGNVSGLAKVWEERLRG